MSHCRSRDDIWYLNLEHFSPLFLTACIPGRIPKENCTVCWWKKHTAKGVKKTEISPYHFLLVGTWCFLVWCYPSPEEKVSFYHFVIQLPRGERHLILICLFRKGTILVEILVQWILLSNPKNWAIFTAFYFNWV